MEVENDFLKRCIKMNFIIGQITLTFFEEKDFEKILQILNSIFIGKALKFIFKFHVFLKV